MKTIIRESIAGIIEGKHFLIFMIYFTLLIPSTRDCFSQSITWQRTYQGPYRDDYGYEIVPAPNNQFYFVGYIDDVNRYVYVLKINQYGDTLWSKLFNNAGANTATNSSDSGCVVAGVGSGGTFSIKLNANGSIIWQKYYTSGGTAWEIKRVSDNGYIICGNAGLNAFIMKLDSLGDFQWSKYFSGGSVKGFKSIVEDEGSGYVLTGYLDLRPAIDSSKIAITKIDYSGNVIWEKTYGVDRLSHGVKIKKTEFGYIVGGNSVYSSLNNKTFLLKVDNNGNQLNLKIFQPSGTLSEYFDDIEFVNPNKYVISNRLDTFYPFLRTHAKVLITDSNFNIIQTKVFYPSYSYASFTSILPLSNGDLLFAGTFDYYTNWTSHRYDYYAVRTDSLLNTSPFPPIGIQPIGTETPSTFELKQNYPNPFNPNTKIKFEVPYKSDIQLIFSDVTGKEIARISRNDLVAGEYITEFNAGNNATGLYFYSLFVNGQLIKSKKMMLIK